MKGLVRQAVAEVRETLREHGSNRFFENFPMGEFSDKYSNKLISLPIQDTKDFIYDFWRSRVADIECRLEILHEVLQKCPARVEYLEDARLKRLEWHPLFGLRERDTREPGA